ncbi:MAG: helix-turn-helix domain-containing protein [Clostridia bacterium]|nr:helix-turn-helix domain-containing protein [Clostridia bacterium]
MSGIMIDGSVLERCTSDKKPTTLIHTYTAVHYILSGKGYFDGKLLGRGDGFVCHRNRKHEYYPDKSDPWTYFWIRIKGDSDEIHSLLDSVGLANEPYTFTFDWEDKILEIADRYYTDGVYESKNQLHDEGLIKIILSEHLSTESKSDNKSRRIRHVEEAKKFMQSNFNKRLTVDEVASHLYISRAYLRNIFCEFTGESPQSYLMNLRIERAKELLLLDRISVTSIATSVGYSDVLTFSKSFKSHTGMSPSEYRGIHLRDCHGVRRGQNPCTAYGGKHRKEERIH